MTLKPFDTTIYMPFGKYRDCPLEEVDQGYLNWCLKMANQDPDSYVGSWVDMNRDEINQAIREYQRNKLTRNMPEYTLSESQQAAVNDIVEKLIYDDGNHIMRLQGGAGYGKSFATMSVVEAATNSGLKVRACATSYVATQVLREQLDPLGIECGTIASMIRLTPAYKGVKETYEPTADTYDVLPTLLEEGNLLIVDEYSMVGDDIANLFTNAANQYGGKLLVVGDAQQLPSPAQDWPSCLDKVEPSTELTTPMRYSQDSTLFQVERMVRANPYQFETGAFVVEDNEVQQYAEWDAFLESFAKIYKENPDLDIRMLWYKRKDMVNANHAIRRALFGDNPALVEDGEQLRIQRTCDYGKPTQEEDRTRYYSGRTYRVLKTWETTENVLGFEIPVTKANLDNDQTVNLLFSVTEGKADTACRGGEEFNAALLQIAQECDDDKRPWKDYRRFRDSFLQVAYSYATTVHRTQGMSADIIFTSPSALKQAAPFQAQRLLYVGLTRAKKQLHCLG